MAVVLWNRLPASLTIPHWLHQRNALGGAPSRPSIRVLPTPTHLSVTLHHHPPALVGERYPLELHIRSHGDHCSSVLVHLDIAPGAAAKSPQGAARRGSSASVVQAAIRFTLTSGARLLPASANPLLATLFPPSTPAAPGRRSLSGTPSSAAPLRLTSIAAPASPMVVPTPGMWSTVPQQSLPLALTLPCTLALDVDNDVLTPGVFHPVGFQLECIAPVQAILQARVAYVNIPEGNVAKQTERLWPLAVVRPFVPLFRMHLPHNPAAHLKTREELTGCIVSAVENPATVPMLAKPLPPPPTAAPPPPPVLSPSAPYGKATAARPPLPPPPATPTSAPVAIAPPPATAALGGPIPDQNASSEPLVTPLWNPPATTLVPPPTAIADPRLVRSLVSLSLNTPPSLGQAVRSLMLSPNESARPAGGDDGVMATAAATMTPVESTPESRALEAVLLWGGSHPQPPPARPPPPPPTAALGLLAARPPMAAQPAGSSISVLGAGPPVMDVARGQAFWVWTGMLCTAPSGLKILSAIYCPPSISLPAAPAPVLTPLAESPSPPPPPDPVTAFISPVLALSPVQLGLSQPPQAEPANATAPEAGVSLRPGDWLTMTVMLQPTQCGKGLPLGHITVTYQRPAEAQGTTPSSLKWVASTVSIPLPAANVEQPPLVIQVRLSNDQPVVHEPFTMTVGLHNPTPEPLVVDLTTTGESDVYLLEGITTRDLVLEPHSTVAIHSRVTYMVAGYHTLPKVTAIVSRDLSAGPPPLPAAPTRSLTFTGPPGHCSSCHAS
ncbi:hypothetical protein PAPYR_5932 [Paratrimastix pyriformis]|uniref:Uncharacterized protein n=1 Tax=Paratrimastix pyriformis TaxID=342808 RepID=A0ABQ8UHV0_9EUKA|nr:hypothetical protein PAPYR_5932 [Paratrimastix pyriformis]